MLRGHLFKNRFFQSSGFQGLFTRSLLFLSFIFFFSLLFLACTPKKKSSKPPAIPTYQIVFDFGDGIDSISFTEKKGSALSDQQIEQIEKQQVKRGHTFNQWRDLDDDDISLNDIRFDGDQTFTAGWNINKYKVTFVMNGATSTINQKSIAYQQKVTEPDKPNRAGMTFVNWYKEDSLDNVFDFATEKIEKDTTIYAGWGYTVTFNGDGATAGTPANIVVLPNDKITKPAKPTKTGETFVNWYKDVSLDTVFNFSTEKIENHTTIYAGWGYTITFNNNGATSGAAGNVAILNGKTVKITEPKKPSKTGMTFINWYKDVSLNTVFDFSTETVDKGTTIYAGWGYQVTFDNNGADSDPAANFKILAGKKITEPTKPSKTGETFINWYKDVSLDTVFDFNTEIISADTTLYAGWGHIVTFSAVSGYGQSTEKVFTGKKATAKTGTYRDITAGKNTRYHKNLYWYKDSGKSRNQYFDFDKETITGDITLYGKFGTLVHFDVDGGDYLAPLLSETVQLSRDRKTFYISKPTDIPTKTGYLFRGWYLNPIKTSSVGNRLSFSSRYDSSVLAYNLDPITIYAKWEKGVTVTFALNGGSGNIPNQTITSGSKVKEPTAPTKTDGTLFAGWYKDISLNTAFDFSTDTITKDTTLYAGWGYQITFNNNGATSDPAANFKILVGKKITEPTKPSKTGMTFINWYKDSSLNTVFDFSETITKNTILYAGWGYQITFNNNGATSDPAANFKILAGKKITEPTKPSRTGFTFVNWYKDVSLDTVFDFNTETITADTTLYAGWGYKVTFVNNGATSDAAADVNIVTGKKVLEPTKPKKTGNVFINWYKDTSFKNVFNFNTETITADTTLYAGWGIPVTFDIDGGKGGTGLKEEVFKTKIGVKSGDKVTEPTPPWKTNFHFIGWFKDSAKTQSFDFSIETITAATTIYAKYRDLELIFNPDHKYDGFSYQGTVLGLLDQYKRVEIAQLTIPSKIYNVDVPSIGTKDMSPFGIQNNSDKTNYIRSFVIEKAVIIGERAFFGSLLTNIVLPDNLEKIGISAFMNCKNLTNIVFPPTLKEINGSAFRLANLQGTIEIPASVEFIGATAFSRSQSSQLTIKILNTDAPVEIHQSGKLSIVSGAFGLGRGDAIYKVLVPNAVLNDWLNYEWGIGVKEVKRWDADGDGKRDAGMALLEGY